MDDVINPSTTYTSRVVRQDVSGNLFVMWGRRHYYAPEGTQARSAIIVWIDESKMRSQVLEVKESEWTHQEQWLLRTIIEKGTPC